MHGLGSEFCTPIKKDQWVQRAFVTEVIGRPGRSGALARVAGEH